MFPCTNGYAALTYVPTSHNAPASTTIGTERLDAYGTAADLAAAFYAFNETGWWHCEDDRDDTEFYEFALEWRLEALCRIEPSMTVDDACSLLHALIYLALCQQVEPGRTDWHHLLGLGLSDQEIEKTLHLRGALNEGPPVRP